MSLEGVKIGDKLLIDNHYNERISAVARITPTGRVVTENGDTFRPNGRRIGETERWRMTRARPANPADFERIRRRSAVYRLDHIQWDKLPTETIDAVLALVDAAPKSAGAP